MNKFQPSLEYTRHQLPGLSLWDPHVLSGRPYIADPQTQLWSPFSIPSYVLPFWKSLAVSAALKLFVAALGAFLLGRALGMRFGGALMTGLAFGFSLWSVRWVSWSLESVWAFLPWLCLFAEMLVRRPAALAWSGLALATGLQWFGGHPSSSFQVLVAVSVFWGLRVLLSAELRQRFPLRLALLGSALAAGTALAAVALIPFAELLAHSGDVGTRSGVTQAFFRQPPHYLLGIFLHDWWGAGRTSYEFAATNQERAYYVGRPAADARGRGRGAPAEPGAVGGARGRGAGTRPWPPASRPCSTCSRTFRASRPPTTAASECSRSSAWRSWPAGGSTRSRETPSPRRAAGSFWDWPPCWRRCRW